jgi:glycosyltransferase involved in cell wall biosynthesis
MNEHPNSHKRIWVINPFDQLPNESDVPLRYWALCRTFAALGHEVIWWSSDFSHLTKSKRSPCPDTDGFSVRLIETPPYSKNISFARLKNHKQFAKRFYSDAMAGLKSGELTAPDRIVVSLPPLGVAEQAFRIRDWINRGVEYGMRDAACKGRTADKSAAKPWPTSLQNCQVVVDIQDAWPEVFHQVIPRSLRKLLSPILLAPLHRSAQRTYQGADKISAVGQSYLDLASNYLGSVTVSCAANSEARINHPPLQAKPNKPMHLCYLGTDLERFALKTSNKEEGTGSQRQRQPLNAVYLGAMGSGYDLMTIIKVAARWKAEGRFPVQIHFAGYGPQLEKLKAESRKLELLNAVATTDSTLNPQRLQTSNSPPPRIIFHGQLGREAVNERLLSSDLALVPNRPDSLVACPNKACEYAAAGLPMISCLGGELGTLLRTWDAGAEYNEGDSASLHAAFEKYLADWDLLEAHSHNARQMAETCFDRLITYPPFAEFSMS